MSTEELLLLGAGAGILYVCMTSNKGGRVGNDDGGFAQADQIFDLQERHMMVGLATGKGHSGSNRYVQTGKFMEILPSNDFEHFASIRGLAARQFHESKGAGDWMRMS